MDACFPGLPKMRTTILDPAVRHVRLLWPLGETMTPKKLRDKLHKAVEALFLKELERPGFMDTRGIHALVDEIPDAPKASELWQKIHSLCPCRLQGTNECSSAVYQCHCLRIAGRSGWDETKDQPCQWAGHVLIDSIPDAPAMPEALTEDVVVVCQWLREMEAMQGLPRMERAKRILRDRVAAVAHEKETSRQLRVQLDAALDREKAAVSALAKKDDELAMACGDGIEHGIKTYEECAAPAAEVPGEKELTSQMYAEWKKGDPGDVARWVRAQPWVRR